METCGHGNDVGAKEEAQPAGGFVSDLDVHVDLGVNPALLRWWLTLPNENKEIILSPESSVLALEQQEDTFLAFIHIDAAN